MKKTLFIDIDGVLIVHKGNLTSQILSHPELIPGTIEKLNKWEADGHKIILTTGRKESIRDLTEKQLLSLGIFYDQLVMGLPRGERIVINDKKPTGDEKTARGIELQRNSGIKDIEL
jgi:hypothetical protein